MDTNLLRSWLGLPPGPWPPPDRELLGLPPGPIVTTDAERRVLERMARLRPHQLVHPELVTEGMNRVAQALLAVTSFTAASDELVLPDQPAVFTGLEVDLQAVVVEAPMVVEAEVVEAEVVMTTPAAPEKKHRPGRVRPAPPPPAPNLPPEYAEVPAITLPVPEIGTSLEDRRLAYRQLAGLRSVRRALDRLRPYFGNRNEPAAMAGGVFGLVESTLALRAALRHPGLPSAGLDAFSPTVAGIACEPLVLAVFRSLGTQQRAALAREWAAGRGWVEASLTSLRTALRNRPVRRRKSAGGPGQAIRSRPEWLLFLLTILVLAWSGIRAFLW
jgi:hypothetical protein